MRDLIRQLVADARRRGDRTDAGARRDVSTRLAAESVRLARLATSIHLAETGRLLADTSGPSGAAGPEPCGPARPDPLDSARSDRETTG